MFEQRELCVCRFFSTAILCLVCESVNHFYGINFKLIYKKKILLPGKQVINFQILFLA